jgi:hypothetical protein
MTRRINFSFLFSIVCLAMTLAGCKPMAYYLEKVDKAYGKVTEAGTGVPLESVEVVLGSYQYTELTNGLGDYELELAEGTWTLHFVKDGYVTVDRVVTVNASNPRVKVDAQLTPVAPPPPPPAMWVVGSWGMRGITFGPYTNLLEIMADGTYKMDDNYDGSGPLGTGNWSLAGNALTMTGMIEMQTTITKVSDNEFVVAGVGTVYRKGYAPGGYVFDKTEHELAPGAWLDGTIASDDMKLYSFTASSTGNHAVEWRETDGTGLYTAGIVVAAYKSDRVTPFFIAEEDLFPSPQTVFLEKDEKIFLIVEAAYGGGTFSLSAQ